MKPIIVIFIVIWFIIYMLKPQKDKKNTDDWQYTAGIRGEKLVRQKLNQLDSRYKTLNDIHYRNAQIDHIVEYHGDNPFVIVIETKTWGGCVSGKVHDKHWIQKENGLTKEYYNPIKETAENFV